LEELNMTTRREALAVLSGTAAALALPLAATAQSATDDLSRVSALIEQHQKVYVLWNELCPFADENEAVFDPEMVPVVRALDEQEAVLMDALINEPVSSFEALRAKGVHLAKINARGGLCYEQAFAFVRSFV
jgi:hypothetical protein